MLLIDEIDKADIEFPNDLLLELDRMEFHVYETGETVQARAAPDRHHHLEQREGAAGRVPAPLLLPLHPLPRRRDDEARSSTCISPASSSGSSRKRCEVFFEMREVPGPEEEALDLRAARLAQAPARPRTSGPSAARARPEEAHPAAARRAAQERAGRAPVREAGVHGEAGGAVSFVIPRSERKGARQRWPEPTADRAGTFSVGHREFAAYIERDGGS